jgi:hypothetical protein
MTAAVKRKRRRSGAVEQLPSGRWRVRVCIGGERYTLPTVESRDEAERLVSLSLTPAGQREIIDRVMAARKVSARHQALANERIYFIQSGESGPIKIGRSDEPERRLAEMQTSHPETLRLLATCPQGANQERRLHLTFQHLRLRRNGEWFKAAPDLLVHIGRCALREKRPTDASGAARVVARLRALADAIEATLPTETAR